jgi:hypothetical protein
VKFADDILGIEAIQTEVRHVLKDKADHDMFGADEKTLAHEISHSESVDTNPRGIRPT